MCHDTIYRSETKTAPPDLRKVTRFLPPTQFWPCLNVAATRLSFCHGLKTTQIDERLSCLMRLRRVETVPALNPAQTPSLPFGGLCDHLRRPRDALRLFRPFLPTRRQPKPLRCGCADHHGTGADRVFGSDGRTTNSLAQTTNSNVEERTSASVASAIAPRRCFSIASRRGRAPKRG